MQNVTRTLSRVITAAALRSSPSRLWPLRRSMGHGIDRRACMCLFPPHRVALPSCALCCAVAQQHSTSSTNLAPCRLNALSQRVRHLLSQSRRTRRTGAAAPLLFPDTWHSSCRDAVTDALLDELLRAAMTFRQAHAVSADRHRNASAESMRTPHMAKTLTPHERAQMLHPLLCVRLLQHLGPAILPGDVAAAAAASSSSSSSPRFAPSTGAEKRDGPRRWERDGAVCPNMRQASTPSSPSSSLATRQAWPQRVRQLALHYPACAPTLPSAAVSSTTAPTSVPHRRHAADDGVDEARHFSPLTGIAEQVILPLLPLLDGASSGVEPPASRWTHPHVVSVLPCVLQWLCVLPIHHSPWLCLEPWLPLLVPRVLKMYVAACHATGVAARAPGCPDGEDASPRRVNGLPPPPPCRPLPAPCAAGTTTVVVVPCDAARRRGVWEATARMTHLIGCAVAAVCDRPEGRRGDGAAGGPVWLCPLTHLLSSLHTIDHVVGGEPAEQHRVEWVAAGGGGAVAEVLFWHTSCPRIAHARVRHAWHVHGAAYSMRVRGPHGAAAGGTALVATGGGGEEEAQEPPRCCPTLRVLCHSADTFRRLLLRLARAAAAASDDGALDSVDADPSDASATGSASVTGRGGPDDRVKGRPEVAPCVPPLPPRFARTRRDGRAWAAAVVYVEPVLHDSAEATGPEEGGDWALDCIFPLHDYLQTVLCHDTHTPAAGEAQSVCGPPRENGQRCIALSFHGACRVIGAAMRCLQRRHGHRMAAAAAAAAATPPLCADTALPYAYTLLPHKPRIHALKRVCEWLLHAARADAASEAPSSCGGETADTRRAAAAAAAAAAVASCAATGGGGCSDVAPAAREAVMRRWCGAARAMVRAVMTEKTRSLRREGPEGMAVWAGGLSTSSPSTGRWAALPGGVEGDGHATNTRRSDPTWSKRHDESCKDEVTARADTEATNRVDSTAVTGEGTANTTAHPTTASATTTTATTTTTSQAISSTAVPFATMAVRRGVGDVLRNAAHRVLEPSLLHYYHACHAASEDSVPRITRALTASSLLRCASGRWPTSRTARRVSVSPPPPAADAAAVSARLAAAEERLHRDVGGMAARQTARHILQHPSPHSTDALVEAIRLLCLCELILAPRYPALRPTAADVRCSLGAFDMVWHQHQRAAASPHSAAAVSTGVASAAAPHVAHRLLLCVVLLWHACAPSVTPDVRGTAPFGSPAAAARAGGLVAPFAAVDDDAVRRRLMDCLTARGSQSVWDAVGGGAPARDDVDNCADGTLDDAQQAAVAAAVACSSVAPAWRGRRGGTGATWELLEELRARAAQHGGDATVDEPAQTVQLRHADGEPAAMRAHTWYWLDSLGAVYAVLDYVAGGAACARPLFCLLPWSTVARARHPLRLYDEGGQSERAAAGLEGALRELDAATFSSSCSSSSSSSLGVETDIRCDRRGAPLEPHARPSSRGRIVLRRVDLLEEMTHLSAMRSQSCVTLAPDVRVVRMSSLGGCDDGRDSEESFDRLD